MSRSGYPPVASVEAELSQNRQRERSGSVSSLRRPPEELVEQESQGDVHNPNQSNLSPEAEDFIHEILAVNTLAMQRCKTEDLNEAVTMLAEAFERLNSDAATSAISDQQLLDQLKATTLCNMGVAECHRGQPRQALSHFEGARQLEDQWNMASPSIALNSCAAYNALRLYDKATAAALETIDMLRTLALQRKRNKKLMKEKQVEEGAAVHSRSIGLIEERPPKRSAEEDAMLNAALQPKIADSENKALWGAAWHNLAVAQVNTAKATRDTSEHSNSLFLFHNAMRATQELLGIQHPMYKAVVDTYRTVRARLHMHGAFKPHHTMQTAPLPKVDPREQEMEELQVEAAEGRSRHATLETQKQDLTITFRGGVTNGQKMVERVDRRAYPDAKDEAYQQGGKKRPKRGKGSSALYSMPLSETLLRATEVYGNPHPLLYSSAATGQNGGWEGADGTYGGGGGAEQSGWGNTYGGPSQQSRHQGKGRQQGKPTSAAAGSRRQPKVHRLPELVRQNDRNGPRGNSANERGQSNRGNSRGPRPHPPQGYSNNGGEGGPQRMGDSSRMNAGQQGGANRGRGGRGNNANSPMSGRQAGAGQGQHWEQSKLLLLAQPPATMSTAYQQVALPSNGAAPQPEPPTSAGSAQQPTEAMPPIPPKDPGQDAMTQVDDELVPTAHQSTTMEPPAAATPRPRDLFGAMWVAADTNYVRHGNRIFGRPGYYVSSVMNVEPTGELVGAAQHVEDLTPAPMMTYSSSSSSRASLSSSTSSAPGACRNALATTVNPTRTLI